MCDHLIPEECASVAYELGNILISKSEIDKRIEEIGSEIAKEYKGKEVIMVGILRDDEIIFEAKFKLAFLKFGKPSKIPQNIFEILEN